MSIVQPLELFEALQAGENKILIDVREPEEFELVSIPGSRLIPLMTLPDHVEELRSLANSQECGIILICRSGQRSQMALEFLEAQGIPKLKNLRGGVNAYAKEADNRLTPY